MFDDSTQFCIELTLIFHNSGLGDLYQMYIKFIYISLSLQSCVFHHPFLNSASNQGNRAVLVLGSFTLSPTKRAHFHKMIIILIQCLYIRWPLVFLGKIFSSISISEWGFQLKQLMTVRAFFMSCIVIRILGKIAAVTWMKYCRTA